MKHLAILTALLLPISGCTTLQTWQANPKVQFAETEAIKLAAAFFSNGGNTDNAWAISAGLSVLGDVATFATQSTAGTAASVSAQVKAFADNPTAVNGLANGLASVVVKVAPSTAAEKTAIVLALSKGIQSAATAVNP